MKQHLDAWLIRGKDILLILGAVGAIFACGIKFYSLPEVVGAQAAQISQVQCQIQTLHEADLKLASRLDNFETAQKYTNAGIDDLKNWMKGISGRIK